MILGTSVNVIKVNEKASQGHFLARLLQIRAVGSDVKV
jgi:hypothetical protein